jgi:hypothetical protein
MSSISEGADETGRKVLLGIFHSTCKPRVAAFHNFVWMLGFRDVQILGELQVPGAETRVAAQGLQLLIVGNDVQLK